ncbi:hypothetical protein [Nostoc sp.]|uniref:hypothetical protein n=1 Tax=Nostoc sp. TaxID=1180 RepID=UPI003FA5C656
MNSRFGFIIYRRNILISNQNWRIFDNSMGNTCGKRSPTQFAVADLQKVSDPICQQVKDIAVPILSIPEKG